MKRYLCILLFGALLCTFCMSTVHTKASTLKSAGNGGGIYTGSSFASYVFMPKPTGYIGDGSDYILVKRYYHENTSGNKTYFYNQNSGKVIGQWIVFNVLTLSDYTSNNLYYPEQEIPIGIFTSNQENIDLINSLGENVDDIYLGITTTDYSNYDWDNFTYKIKNYDPAFGSYFIRFKPDNISESYIWEYPENGTSLDTKYTSFWKKSQSDDSSGSSSTIEVQPLDSQRTGLIDQIGSIFGSYTPYSHGVDFQVVFGYGLILLLVYFCGRMMITLLNK